MKTADNVVHIHEGFQLILVDLNTISSTESLLRLLLGCRPRAVRYLIDKCKVATAEGNREDFESSVAYPCRWVNNQWEIGRHLSSLGTLCKKVKAGIRPDLALVCCTDDIDVQELMTIMQLCWQQDPKLRPSIGKVIDMLEKYSREELLTIRQSLIDPIEAEFVVSDPWYVFPRTRRFLRLIGSSGRTILYCMDRFCKYK